MPDPAPSLRVLQVVLSLNPGGTERLVLDLARRLHPQMPMRVCCLDEAGAWAGVLREQGIDVDPLGRLPGFQPDLGRRIAALARRHGAQVVHAHHYSPFVYSCLAKWLAPGLRVIYTEHGRVSDAPPSPKRRLVNRAVFSHCPASVFAVSGELRTHLVREGFRPAQVDVIYNGIDVCPQPDAAQRAEVRRALGVSDDTFVVGTIARLDPVKDLGTLLRATAEARRERSITVVLIGDGSERAALQTAATALGIGANARFLGHREDARRWLAGCDAFVNCSVSEGVSLTILEAMAAGLPVVATAVGGTPEVVTPACGLLVPPRDHAALARALLSLAGDAARRQAMSESARARVEHHFTLERMVQQYRSVYNGVA